MKKLLFILFFLILSIKPVFAQEIIIPTQGISPTPTEAPKLVYEFPYPGILPGSPLYFFKVARDKISEILITDSEKKSRFFLLQSDKRFSSSEKLFKLGKNDLAEQTLSKGQNYLENSIDEVIKAKKSGENMQEVLSRIQLSTRKQEEEIKGIENGLGEKNGKLLEISLQRATELKNRANKIQPN